MIRTELWHVALSHFPIAFLSATLPLFLVAVVLTKMQKQKDWAANCFFSYRLALYFGTAFTAINLFLGDEAAMIVSLEICDRSVLYRHEDYAHYLLILSVLLSVGDILYLGLREKINKIYIPVTVALALVLQGLNLYFLVLTAHYGGDLVYEQGAAVIPADCRNAQ